MSIYNERVIVIKACGFDTAGIPLTPIAQQGAILTNHADDSVLIVRLTLEEIHRIRGQAIDPDTAEPTLSVEDAIRAYAEGVATSRPYFVTTRDKLPQEPLPEFSDIFRNAWRYSNDSIIYSLDEARNIVKASLRALHRNAASLLNDPFSGLPKEKVESLTEALALIKPENVDACTDLASLKQLYYDIKILIDSNK
jgi:hypothetical protein